MGCCGGRIATRYEGGAVAGLTKGVGVRVRGALGELSGGQDS